MVCKWQLESLGNVINIKNHQIMELKMVEFDAKNSRMSAKKELDEVGERLLITYGSSPVLHRSFNMPQLCKLMRLLQEILARQCHKRESIFPTSFGEDWSPPVW